MAAAERAGAPRADGRRGSADAARIRAAEPPRRETACRTRSTRPTPRRAWSSSPPATRRARRFRSSCSRTARRSSIRSRRISPSTRRACGPIIDRTAPFDVVDRRRRPGRSRRRRVRVVGGARRARRRARVDRRPGEHEHPHPQLPRVLTRAQRRRADPARVPAGVGLRRDVPAHARASRRSRAVGAGFELEISGGTTVEARSVILATGVSYRRLDVPGARGARGPRRPLRLVAVRGAAVHGRERLHRRRGELGRPGGGAPRALRRERDARLPRAGRLLDHVAVPDRRDHGQGEHPRPQPHAGRRSRGRRPTRARDAARAGR